MKRQVSVDKGQEFDEDIFADFNGSVSEKLSAVSVLKLCLMIFSMEDLGDLLQFSSLKCKNSHPESFGNT